MFQEFKQYLYHISHIPVLKACRRNVPSCVHAYPQFCFMRHDTSTPTSGLRIVLICIGVGRRTDHLNTPETQYNVAYVVCVCVSMGRKAREREKKRVGNFLYANDYTFLQGWLDRISIYFRLGLVLSDWKGGDGSSFPGDPCRARVVTRGKGVEGGGTPLANISCCR